MFSQLLSLSLWDPCCIPCCTCNLEACNKSLLYNKLFNTSSDDIYLVTKQLNISMRHSKRQLCIEGVFLFWGWGIVRLLDVEIYIKICICFICVLKTGP